MKVKLGRVDLSSKSGNKVEKADERHRVRQVKEKDLRSSSTTTTSKSTCGYGRSSRNTLGAVQGDAQRLSKVKVDERSLEG